VSIVDDRRLDVIVRRDTTFEWKLDAATSRPGLLNFTPYGKEDRQDTDCIEGLWVSWRPTSPALKIRRRQPLIS
jgi:hypothetical protein